MMTLRKSVLGLTCLILQACAVGGVPTAFTVNVTDACLPDAVTISSVYWPISNELKTNDAPPSELLIPLV